MCELIVFVAILSKYNLSVNCEKRGGGFKTRKQLNLNTLTVSNGLKSFHIMIPLIDNSISGLGYKSKAQLFSGRRHAQPLFV
jgi:hypothetical protein